MENNAAVEDERDDTDVSDPDVAEPAKGDAVDNAGGEIEEIARAMGWCEKDKWRAENGKKWIPAKDFILREHDITARLHEKLAKTEKTVANIHDHFQKQLAVERAKAKEELKEAKRKAIVDGDVDEVDRIEKEIETVNKEDRAEGDNGGAALLDEWKEKNKWYGDDADLTEIADALSVQLEEKGLKLPAILIEIDKKMKRLVSGDGRGDGGTGRRASVVEGGGGNKGETTRTRKLTPEQEDACRVMVRNIPGFTREQYIKDITEYEKNGA